MTIDDLNNNLDKAISKFESDAAKANNYCQTDATGYAFQAMRDATKQALQDFKSEILTYLSQN